MSDLFIHLKLTIPCTVLTPGESVWIVYASQLSMKEKNSWIRQRLQVIPKSNAPFLVWRLVVPMKSWKCTRKLFQKSCWQRLFITRIFTIAETICLPAVTRTTGFSLRPCRLIHVFSLIFLFSRREQERDSSQDLNPVDYEIWAVTQRRVYHRQIHIGPSVDKLKRRLLDVCPVDYLRGYWPVARKTSSVCPC